MGEALFALSPTRRDAAMTTRLPHAHLLVAIALAGCATGPASIVDLARGAFGAPRPAVPPELSAAPRTVALRLHASDKLNVDADGRPLALVARLYTLRQGAAFEQAPYAAFRSAATEQEAFGADLLAVRELTLLPGQHYDLRETIVRQAAVIGIVALFHAPSAQRWRLAFDAAEAERSGLAIGVHACSLSVAGQAAPARAPLRVLPPIDCP
jgi:type VI secretion system protein VasD